MRQEADGIRRYCHLGTGNYNPKTARLYEDLGLLPCDPELGADLTELFNFLTGYSRQTAATASCSWRPPRCATGMVELIARARSQRRPAPAASCMKMNSLSTRAIIDALYEASQAGVRDRPDHPRHLLPARRACPGCRSNIRVRSIVGRFLEHSRIYHFANGGGDGGRGYFIGSADLMPRNLDRRVEAMTPVDDPELQERLEEILDVNLADDTLAWTARRGRALGPGGAGGGVDTHLRLQAIAAGRTRQPG